MPEESVWRRLLRLAWFGERAKQYVTPESQPGPLWYPLQSVREPFTGAWQRNISARSGSLNYAIYSTIGLIIADISKLRPRLMAQDPSGIWTETASPTFSPVLAKPNDFQNSIQFFEQWVASKLLHGNTYVLKERDNRGAGPTQGAVRALYVLDAVRTRPLVTDTGDIYYETARDNLAGVDEERLVIPASEIIHDRMRPLFHPLCGVSPLVAAMPAATISNHIQEGSASFFANQSRPSGILIAPGRISDTDAKRLKEHWEQHYTGDNTGRVAVVGDGLKYETLGMTAVDAQLLEQLKWSAETVASCFNVPAHKIGAGQMPNLNNVESLDQQYYSQCLQGHIVNIERSMTDGLGLLAVPGRIYAMQFDLDDLFRMDTATLMKALSDGVRAGVLAPNEGRRRVGYKPVPGGDSPYLQHQDYSLAALAKRDAKPDPFAGDTPAPSPDPANPPPAAPPVDPEPQKTADTLQLDLEQLAQLTTLEANIQLRLLTAA